MSLDSVSFSAVRMCWGIALVACTGSLQAQSTPPLRKHVGSPDYPTLLKEPAVKKNLDAVVGKQLPALMRNINVTGDIDRIGGALAIAGNAPHKGGEEEGVICVSEFDGKVEAAIFSKSRITVFARDQNYEHLMLCIKDWITQVNSGHRDRFKQPTNVRFAAPH
ncbi:MAG: hypothetical protein HS128_23010 [Ideonella sp.]|nr:hypothetical protein [Ideonella sp.]MCC7456516.1 hypothetical protein [Nitrospira sp.]